MRRDLGSPAPVALARDSADGLVRSERAKVGAIQAAQRERRHTARFGAPHVNGLIKPNPRPSRAWRGVRRLSRERRPAERTRLLVPPHGAGGGPHARRLDDHLRGAGADPRRVPRPHRLAPAPGAPLPPEAALRPLRPGPPGLGRRSRTSTSTTTCARPRCRRPAPRSSCATWRRGSSPSSSTAPSRSGSCGWSRASSGDRFAIVGKSHHALVDGVSGVDITTVLFDLEPEPTTPPRPPAALGAAARADRPAAARRGAARAC